MKLFLILLSTVTLFLSCTKKNEKNQLYKSDFVIYLDAVYKEDDSTFLKFYNKKGVEIPELLTKATVIGSPVTQRIVYRIKPSVKFSNIYFFFSTNKQQKTIEIKGITIKKNDEFVIGGPGDRWDYYFLNNDQIEIDMVTGVHKLQHNKAYPPGLNGNHVLKSLIARE